MMQPSWKCVLLLLVSSFQFPAFAAPNGTAQTATRMLVRLQNASISIQRGQALQANFLVMDSAKKGQTVYIRFPSHSFTEHERKLMDTIEKAVSWDKPADPHEEHTAVKGVLFLIPESANGYTTDFTRWEIVPVNSAKVREQLRQGGL